MGIYGLKSILKVPHTVIYGTDTISELPEQVKRFGKVAAVVYGGKSFSESGNRNKIMEILKSGNVAVHEVGGISHDPDELLVKSITETIISIKPDVIIGIGGGSVIDTAKAASIIASNGGEVADYWEGKPFTKPSIPYIAVPTTSGTGAEVTKNAVITSKEKTFKKSIRSDYMIPDVALIDPSLTLSLPKTVTRDTGLDALIQNLEGYTSNNAGPITDTLARKGIELAGTYLVQAFRNPDDLEAREAMSLVSLYGGITLLNAGLGLAHGLSHPIGIRFGLPHGRSCAIVMPKVMEYNYTARKQKYDEVGQLLSGDRNGVKAFNKLLERLDLSTRLGDYGIKEEDIPLIVSESKGGSRNYNPIHHSDETVEKMLKEIL
ncbi:MAG: iron-containing alcohol dehydrogenase [Spirochaetota bacterium]|nr:MAG: iron-containing alcohol dehydrogenase [Spirochaetota bacterium]